MEADIPSYMHTIVVWFDSHYRTRARLTRMAHYWLRAKRGRRNLQAAHGPWDVLRA